MSEACPPRKKKLYIETVGCQMNLLDSELVVGKLRGEGYELTDDIGQADTILYNTCSVRQHAEDKIYSALGRIKNLKRDRPHVSIGVLGCMAQKDQGQILRRAPHVDVVIGPGQLGRVSELLDEARPTASRRWPSACPGPPGTPRRRHRQLRRVRPAPRAGDAAEPVPGVRPDHDGVRQVLHLLHRPLGPRARAEPAAGRDRRGGPDAGRPGGQGDHPPRPDRQQLQVPPSPTAGPPASPTSWPGSTRSPGVERIKFITNFPNDMTDDLLQAVRDLPKVSRYLHVPAQSGCDEVLKRMKRGYTVALYDEMLRRIRETVPDAAVSSDFIVGFCGETEASFGKSMELVERPRFKNSYIFKYSPRLGTKADTLLIDDVPEEVKRRRNNELLALQNAISAEDHRAFVGRTVEVLVEGPSKTAPGELGPGEFGQLTGRTWCDRIVVFDGPGRLIGRFLPVEVEGSSVMTLFGRAATREVAAALAAGTGRLTGVRMASQLADLVDRWCDASGVDPALRPDPARLDRAFGPARGACRPGADPARLASWERRFGFALPDP